MMKTGPVLEKGISGALFWGSVWGSAEASMGHILHLLRVPGLAGFVMIPIGILMMARAFKDSGRSVAVFLTSAVAAGLKFVDFLIPGTDPAVVVRPALAILAQGLALASMVSLAVAKAPFSLRARAGRFRMKSFQEIKFGHRNRGHLERRSTRNNKENETGASR